MKKTLLKIFLIIIVLFTVNVNADGIDPTKTSTATIKYSYGDKNFANKKAYIYKIADIDADRSLTYTEEFKNLSQSLENLTASQLSAFATTVDNQITMENISPLAEQITDMEGIAQFNSLSPAVYFLKMDTVTENDYQYRSIPIIITAPLYDEGIHQYKYEFSVMIKTEAKYIGEQVSDGNTTNPPNTVDDIMIYAAIFIISLAVIIGLVCYINKKRRKEVKNEKIKK